MAFFQNPFFEEFRGTLPTGDRSSVKPFVIKGNAGRDFNSIVNYNPPLVNNTFDLSGNDANGGSKGDLKVRFAYRDYTMFMTLTVTIAGVTPAATTPSEIVNNLNGDPTFSTYFAASLKTLSPSILATTSVGGSTSSPGVLQQISINSKKTNNVKFYVVNSGAETVLGFNKKAGVVDLPAYFARHTVDNLTVYPDSTGSLVQLGYVITNITKASPAHITSTAHGLSNGDLVTIYRSNSSGVIDGTSLTVTKIDADTFTATKNAGTTAGTMGLWSHPVDVAVITNAVNAQGKSLNYTLATAQFDYQLLNGASSSFMFVNQTSATLPYTAIHYPAGSQAGDLAVKYTCLANGSVIQTPYILTSGDLIAETSF